MNIFIGNLSFDATEADIKKLFEDFGAVSSVIIVKEKKGAKSRGFGFLTMLDDQQALAAIKALSNREFMGRPLIVSPERPKLPEELDRRRIKKTGPDMRVGTKAHPREKASLQEAWFSPVFKRPGRRSRYERHSDEDTDERSKPWRKTAGQRSEAKPWQKTGERSKPWRKPEGQRLEAKPWQKKQEFSRSWKKSDARPKPWGMTEGRPKPWQKTMERSKPWRKAEGQRPETKPWEKKREFSRPWRKAEESPRPWQRTEGRQGQRPEARPWQKKREFSKPWQKTEERPKPWQRTEGRAKSWHKPGESSKPKRAQSYKR
jgi:RNA recognition motif-containing protein